MTIEEVWGKQLFLDDATLHAICSLPLETGDSLSISEDDGEKHPLPSDIADFLFRVLISIASDGEVDISGKPEVISSNAAAEILGDSRPMLMKSAREDVVDSTKASTHTRFKYQEVHQLKTKLENQRREAFSQL